MNREPSFYNERGGAAAFKLVDAVTAAQIEECRKLFHEYEQHLGVDLRFQDFEQEVEDLPGAYAPPDGALILAVTATGGEVCNETTNTETAGCVALRRLAPGICEMKRLFVRPRFRGTGIGRQLARLIIEKARSMGYGKMRLDTLDFLTGAISLYRSLGFRQIEPYYDNPLSGVLYWELGLAPDDPVNQGFNTGTE